MPLTLEDVSFTYPGAERPTVTNVSFCLGDGTSIALMAPSGSGKSTLLALAGGALRPTSGQISLTSRRADTKPVVAWIFQSVNLLPRRSVVDNIVLPALAAGVDRAEAEERANILLADLGILPLAARTAMTLSGGEAQRVGIARALVREPDLLLADEPTANLDRATATLVASQLRAAARNTAYILATHDDDVAATANSIYSLRSAS